jgi:hypothetical protein
MPFSSDLPAPATRRLLRMNGRFAPEAALGGIEIPLPLYPRKLSI